MSSAPSNPPVATTEQLICSVCSKTDEVKKCGACKDAQYCSRDCQRKDWSSHKKTCTGRKKEESKAQPKALSYRTSAPTTAANLFANILEVGPPEGYRRIIDVYRLRVEDTYVFGEGLMGLYAQIRDDPGGPPPRQDFEEYLDKAEKAKVLPSWWNKEERAKCISLAMDEKGGSFIGHAVEKHDVQDEYKDSMMPMKMRMVAEKVWGWQVGGHKSPESLGVSANTLVSHLNISQ